MLDSPPILAAVTVIALLAIGAGAILQVRLQTLLRHRGPVRRVAVPLLLLGLLLPTVAQASPAPLPLRWRSSAIVSGEGEISSGRASREGSSFGENRTSGFRLFLQVDPSGYADSPNLYAGFANDPVNNRDPTGRSIVGWYRACLRVGLPIRACAEIFGVPETAEAFADRVDRASEAAAAKAGEPLYWAGCGMGLAQASPIGLLAPNESPYPEASWENVGWHECMFASSMASTVVAPTQIVGSSVPGAGVTAIAGDLSVGGVASAKAVAGGSVAVEGVLPITGMHTVFSEGEDVSNVPPAGNNGPRVYEPNPKHGDAPRATSKGVSSPEPIDGHGALNSSVQVKPTSNRRVGVDVDGSFVVFDEHRPGRFHGHVRAWNELTDEMRNALRRAGLVNRRGKVVRR